MDKRISQQIEKRLDNHEKRIRALEGSEIIPSGKKSSGSEKQKTLREIVKGRKFKNGQQQVAVVVGYYENTLGTLIHKDHIKTEWNNAKMTNKYNKTFIDRAKDKLIRVRSNGTCDLTQTGEDFFENFLKNESTGSASQ